MRTIPATLQAALDTGAATLCRAWALTRTDGQRLGFTDHDGALSFDGLSFEAASGLTQQAVEQATGLSTDSHTVEGALQSAAISDLDIERGLYDGAEILFYLVDWTDTTSRLLLARGFIGEVRRGDGGFEAEVVGLAERMNQPFGRAFVYSCDLRLGETACGIDLTGPQYRGTGQVVAVGDGQQFTVSGLDGFETGWFARGGLTWTSGLNQPEPGHVRAHRKAAGLVTVELWQSPAAAVAVGDGFEITAGCDKTFATCREKFANALNFRGFPHIPGDDWAAAYPNSGENHDGGSLFRG